MEEENMGKAYQMPLLSMKALTLSFVLTFITRIGQRPTPRAGTRGECEKLAITASRGLCWAQTVSNIGGN